MRFLSIFAFLVVPSLVACIVDTRRSEPAPESETPVYNPPVQPLIVSVATNQVMTAAGGEGVGVFVEYRAGGHWHVWMACDTNRTGQNCNFDVQITPNSGSFHQVAASEGSASNLTITQNPSLIEATTIMTTEINGIDFDADPGARITIDAAVSNLHTGDFFFFVENNSAGDAAVNGGFKGVLTDPIIFEPSQP